MSSTNHQPRWISSVASLSNTDMIASGIILTFVLYLITLLLLFVFCICAGSEDGFIRLWKCGENFRSLTQLMSIPARGFVNSLAFTSDGTMLIAGMGQEHRLGRWWRDASAKNEILVVPLRRKEKS